MPWLSQAMTFAWITHQDCLDAAPFQRHVHLFRLRDVHVVVVLAVKEERGSLGLSHVS